MHVEQRRRNMPGGTAFLHMIFAGLKDKRLLCFQQADRTGTPGEETREPSESSTIPRTGFPVTNDDQHSEKEAVLQIINSALWGEIMPTWDCRAKEPSSLPPFCCKGCSSSSWRQSPAGMQSMKDTRKRGTARDHDHPGTCGRGSMAASFLSQETKAHLALLSYLPEPLPDTSLHLTIPSPLH